MALVLKTPGPRAPQGNLMNIAQKPKRRTKGRGKYEVRSKCTKPKAPNSTLAALFQKTEQLVILEAPTYPLCSTELSSPAQSPPPRIKLQLPRCTIKQ